MLPKTMRRIKISVFIMCAVIIIQCLAVGCLKGVFFSGSDVCRRFFLMFPVEILFSLDAFFLMIGLAVVIVASIALAGNMLEWRDLMKLYRQLAETRGTASTFSEEGTVRADISLNVEGMPLRLLVERAIIDQYGNEYGKPPLILPPSGIHFSSKHNSSVQYRVKIIFAASRPFDDVFHIFFKAPFFSKRTTQNIDEYKLKKRLRCTSGDKEAAQQWIARANAAALADLDVRILEQIDVNHVEFSLIVARIPDDMDKIDAVLKASARLYRDFLQSQGFNARLRYH